jgi:hypothetical protein
MESENENLKNELEQLKKELALLKPVTETPVVVEKKKRGRPKSENTIPRAEYMKNYMKAYNEKNKDTQKLRHNNYYYLNNSEMPKEYIQKYGLFACLVYKTKIEVDKIKNDCPQFLSDVII